MLSISTLSEDIIAFRLTMDFTLGYSGVMITIANQLFKLKLTSPTDKKVLLLAKKLELVSMKS